jgi:hypothetical protein
MLDEAEAEALVEATRADVRREGIEDHGLHGGIREAALQRELHDARAVAAAEILGLADPDVDSPQIGRYIMTPVVRFFACRIEDLNEGDGATFVFRDELFAPVGRS